MPAVIAPLAPSAASRLSPLAAHLKAILLTLAVLAIVLPSEANIGFVPLDAQLVTEKVEICIAGDQATVSGTFEFRVKPPRFRRQGIPFWNIYLPVYAKRGASIPDITPTILQGRRKLAVDFVNEDQRALPQEFRGLPSIPGQEVHWFRVHTGVQKKSLLPFKLRMSYKQALAGGRFIYTPLIPGMEAGRDYGTITLTSDRPLVLENAAKHQFSGNSSRLVVKPAHKRAIVVRVKSNHGYTEPTKSPTSPGRRPQLSPAGRDRGAGDSGRPLGALRRRLR
jgi:hypothetical protein